jgi:thymidine phosphorylase
VQVNCLFTDGRQPIGRGIGPALEARDVLAVLQNAPDAPADLRERALLVAGAVLELGGKASAGDGIVLAAQTLDSGKAWDKFRRICIAQGGLRTPPQARLVQALTAPRDGKVLSIDNRRLSRLAKLAGAPECAAAGVHMAVRLDDTVQAGQPLLHLHADSPANWPMHWTTPSRRARSSASAEAGTALYHHCHMSKFIIGLTGGVAAGKAKSPGASKPAA